MANKLIFIVFWIVFAGLFLLFFFPAFSYFSKGFPEYMSIDTTAKRIIFTTHILSGIIVYISAFFQFAPFIRNKRISFHRNLGKVYVTAAVVCIGSLYYIISLGKNAGLPFWPSQYAVTTLWLLFIFLAMYFVRKRRIVWHQRLMISGFICAAYFVSVRIIDRFCMGIFKSLFSNEGTALLVSDLFVWTVPLVVCWSYWLLQNKRPTKTSLKPSTN